MLIPIPYAADRDLRGTPFVTLFLVLFNCLIFLMSLLGGPLTLKYIVQNYGLRGVDPDIVTVFTSVVLHASVMHLIANMAFLWIFGCLVEDVLGQAQYVLFYLGSGVAGGLLRIIVAQKLLPVVTPSGMLLSTIDQPAVGASGAVAGILGLFAIRFYRARIKTLLLVPIAVPALPAIGLWVGAQAACATWSLYAHTDTGYWAHLGGFAFGILSGILMQVLRDAEKEYLTSDLERAERDLEGNKKRALARLRQLDGRNPNNPRIHRALAKAYQHHGLTDVAEMHARKAVELALAVKDVDTAVENYLGLRGILSVLEMGAQYDIACALESQHRLTEAAIAYRKVYEYYPDRPLAGTALIRCIEMLRRRPGGAPEAAELAREYLERYHDGEWRAQAARYAREV